MLSDSEWAFLERKAKFTGRELQSLRGVFDEKTDDAIAAELGITARTVRAHLQQVYRKLGCRTRSGAIVAAFRMLRAAHKAESTEKLRFG